MPSRDWQPVEARVVAARELPNYRKHYAYAVVAPQQFVIEYKFDDGASQRVELDELYGKMIPPAVGDAVSVLVERKSGKVKWDAKNPKLDLKASKKADQTAENATFDAALRGSARSQPAVETSDDTAGPNEDADKSIEQARQIWRENLKLGYCTQEEFDRQMRDLDEA